MKRSLYEIVQSIRSLIWLAEENEGIIDDDTLAELNELESVALPEKANAIICVVEEMRAQAGVYHARGKKQMEYSGRLTKAAKRLLTNLQTGLEETGMEKCATEDFPSLRVQQNPPRVLVTDEAAIHLGGEYIREAKPTVDKRALLNDLKAGKEIAGAELVRTKGLRW